jgi:next-to-BRCA1 protein 1
LRESGADKANEAISSSAQIKARFVRDESFPDGTKVSPMTKFQKVWRVRNDGLGMWPEGCSIVHASGDILTSSGLSLSQTVPQIAPGLEGNISLDLLAPDTEGRYVEYFRFQSPSGQNFGQRLWADIRVVNPESCAPQVDKTASADEGKTEKTPWSHELDVLRSMGFTDSALIIPMLEEHVKTPASISETPNTVGMQVVVGLLLGSI